MRYLDDGDVVLHHGDVLEVLAGLPSESVDSCVTSPPYFGLRDYGTGRWEGGDEGCVHRVGDRVSDSKAPGAITTGVRPGVDASRCRNCGATRIDQQIGLEDTPEAYITRLVGVFQQVRRVLAPHGTCFVNMGDSYAGSWGNQGRKAERGTQRPINGGMLTPVHDGRYPSNGSNTGKVPDGYKPKDLLGIPWRLAFALQDDGWWLRSDVIWSKPNPMPESVTDRPTKAHEYLFLLTKAPRYFWDAEGVREPHTSADDPRNRNGYEPNRERNVGGRTDGLTRTSGAASWPAGGRNVRSVWTFPTEPNPEAHFATFPRELVRRCLAAGCPERVCRTCGEPSRRIVEREANGKPRSADEAHNAGANLRPHSGYRGSPITRDIGWSDCGHDDYRPGIVLDPFIGSGTTAVVARAAGRRCVGIDLNLDYLEIAKRRTQQLSLLGDAA